MQPAEANGDLVGSALGCVQSPFIVTSEEADEVGEQLFNMFLYQAIITACMFGVVAICKSTGVRTFLAVKDFAHS